jgi:hypothetical protein
MRELEEERRAAPASCLGVGEGETKSESERVEKSYCCFPRERGEVGPICK